MFASEFHDMMPDTVLAQPGHVSATGAFVASGEVVTLEHCRVEGGPRLVRLSTGEEVVASVTVIVGEFVDLTAERHRYTLPARFSPRSNLKALSVIPVTDEDGGEYVEVYLP